MTSKRWWVGVSLTTVMLALAAMAWAADGDKPAPPKREHPQHLTGTVLDAGLNALSLDKDALAKVSAALAPWKEKNVAAKAAATSQADAIKASIKEERAKKPADKARIDDLKKQLEAVDNSLSPADQYKSARDLLKGVLAEEQLTKVDAGAREATFGTATKMFDSEVGNWSKKGVALTPDQKDKVAAVQGKLKDELAKLDVGANSRGVVSKLVAEAKATLPQDLQDKLNARRPASKPDGEGKRN
jgi:hypothetical protein